jgi:hypothetical protein
MNFMFSFYTGHSQRQNYFVSDLYSPVVKLSGDDDIMRETYAPTDCRDWVTISQAGSPRSTDPGGVLVPFGKGHETELAKKWRARCL